MLANANNASSVPGTVNRLVPLHQHTLSSIQRIKIKILFLSVCDDSPLIAQIASFLQISQLIRLGSLSKYTHRILKHQHIERRILKTKLDFYQRKKAYPYQLDDLPLLLSKYWMPLSSVITQSKPISIKRVKAKKEHPALKSQPAYISIQHEQKAQPRKMNYVQEIKMKNSQEIDAVIRYDQERERRMKERQGGNLEEIRAKFQNFYKSIRQLDD